MNILIVDDQKQVLDGIRASIAWEDFPEIKQVYYEGNAASAKNRFLETPIDLLVSDIEMPGESGLELLSWVNANFPGTKCIMLTAHASFDYAQDALRMKAIDYILQPVRYEVLKESIRKGIRLIREERMGQDPSFWNRFHGDVEKLILKDYFADGKLETLLEKARQIHVPLAEEEEYILLLIDETLESGSLDSWADRSNTSLLLTLARQYFSRITDYCCIFEQYTHHFWILLHATGEPQDYYSITQSFIDFCRENDRISMVVYLGKRETLENLPAIYSGLYDLYRNNVAYVQKLFTLEDNTPVQAAPMPPSVSWPGLFANRMTDVIETQILAYIRRTTESGSMNSRTLLALQETFLHTFYESLQQRKLRIRNVFEQEEYFDILTQATRSTEDFLRFMRKIFEYNAALDPLVQEEDATNIVEKAQEYIAAHISEELSRETIARETFVSESYLSHLFPKETGQSLTSYITNERMALAKSLLTKSTLPVQIIAIRAGYNNISYFIKTFKKTYGVTPNDYRKGIIP